MAEQARARIADRLAGKTVLVTGVTGFVGKAVLAACLHRIPGLGEVRVLVRARDDEGAAHRLRAEVLAGPAFTARSDTEGEPGGADQPAGEDQPGGENQPSYEGQPGGPDTGGHGETAVEWLESGRLRALAADLTVDGLGREEPLDLSSVDVVIHCAASVSFEDPLDDMIELNVLGPLRLVAALRESGASAQLVHVSTAYAAGMRTGLVLERPSGRTPAEPAVDLQAELGAARAWRHQLEAESRLPEHQRRFVAEARREIGPAGPPAVGARAEAERRAWVRAQLSERGRERSRALGWSDAYTLTKGLAERLLTRERLEALTIVRPSIIESALSSPYPGWIEDLKVADPVILAYGRGLVPRFPGDPAVRLDIVPVDLVANACVVAAAHAPKESPRIIALASGSRRPLLVGEAAQLMTDYFQDRPLPDEDGLPVAVGEFRFAPKDRVMVALDRGEQALRIGRRLIDRVPVPRGDDVERRLHNGRRRLERLRRLAEIYGSYIELDCIFDDRHALELLEDLHPDDRADFDFDVARIHWPTYFRESHLPALRELVGLPRLPSRPVAGPARVSAVERRDGRLVEGPPAPCFFDVEGVVLGTTVAHFYAWLRTQDMPAPDRALWSLGLAARAPGYLVADRRSRAAFNRRFYRNYRGLPAGELREQAGTALSEFILPRMHQEAVRRIRAHRQRGDHVVLLTGALDFLVAPLSHLADDLVAARLTERGGAFTGELAEPPLTADGRASLAARIAAEHRADLADCHAYGDSASDLPLLELVGHPHAVNPDFRLAREARRRGWPVLEWNTEPGARTRPAAPAEA